MNDNKKDNDEYNECFFKLKLIINFIIISDNNISINIYH